MSERSRTGEVFLYFLRLGATVFGGVGPQLARMERELVAERRWLSLDEFRRGVSLAYLCPGPVGTQAGVYCGWKRAGWKGSIAALIGFLLPALILIGFIAEAHERWGASPSLAAAAAGARCAVIPIIALSCLRLSRSMLPTNAERGLALAAAFLCAFLPAQATLAVLGAGLLLALSVPRERRGAAAVGLPPLFLVGLQAGLLVYGTGQAILPVIREAVVMRHAWLSETQFADAISAGLITPGPIVLSLAYIGHIAAGWPGALAATAGVFLPAWALVLIVGPFMERLERNPRISAFARGATAGAIGGVAAAAFALGHAALVSPTSWAFAAVATAAVLSEKIPDAAVIIGAGLAAIAFM